MSHLTRQLLRFREINKLQSKQKNILKLTKHSFISSCTCNNVNKKQIIGNTSKVHSIALNSCRTISSTKTSFTDLVPPEQHTDDKNNNTESWTHFGYENVKSDHKENKVYDVFENVASSYDLMNDLMSAGTHRLWKSHFVNQLKLKPGMKILDMAGGTGDIAFKLLDNLCFGPKIKKEKTQIIVSDINQAMLDVGRKRAQKLNIEQEFDWVQANAEDLPFEDESLDLYTIAFGIRNTTHIDRVLEEAYRVLKVGGRFSCLEFSNVPNTVIKNLYDAYSFQIIPVLGQIFAQDWKSYQYLVESIRQFPEKDEFADMIYDAGFSNVMFEDMTFGVVSIHDGFKI